MAENVQWIRLKVGMFDGNSFKKIKRAKIGGVSYRDKLTAVWFELLDLAGKSNANGYLIDNNEIPYQTFEDIATMLDREEKEIELCMQFFINERMVEIVDEIYCLTNFMMYQNQEGLEKIREQKRIAQAKWRERKKQGLVGNVVESTNLSTSNLLSNSISNSNSNFNSNSISNQGDNIEDSKEEKINKKEKKTRAKKEFVPPTYEEVIEYARSRNREDLARKFFDYFEAGDWIDSKGNKVRNWKQKFITWESNNPNNEKGVNNAEFGRSTNGNDTAEQTELVGEYW